MAKSKKNGKKREPLPENFDSIQALWDFWDTRSTADYEDLMEDVDFEVDIKSSKIFCAVDKELVKELHSRAQRRGISTETLINLLLREKMDGTVHGE